MIGGKDGIQSQLERFESDLESMGPFQEAVANQHHRIIKDPTPETSVDVLPKLRDLSRQTDVLFKTSKARIHAKHLVATVESICISARIQRPSLVQQGQRNYAVAVSDWNTFRQEFRSKLTDDRVSKSRHEIYRQWISFEGKFSVQARLVKVAAEQVVLERDDGKQITVPRKKLSAADQAFLNERTDADSAHIP